MNRFGRCFRNLLQDKMYFATHYTFRRYVCRWRHKIRKIAVEILHSVNNRTQCVRESTYYAWLLLTYIVINTILGRLTLDPAGMHCPSWDDAFVSSCMFLCGSALLQPVRNVCIASECFFCCNFFLRYVNKPVT